MEDFRREFKAGAALFLLYGEIGVGKTRLMQELCQNRLAASRIHWLDLAAEASGDYTLHDSSAKVEDLFKAAQNGDIVVADHFEMALNKTRHQLFLSWSTDGVDKNLNLIIASSTEGFNELRQLSQQYQVRVQSFQHMPFSPDEVDAFLGFHLFPDHPTGKLSMPAALRNNLASTHGVVGQIIEIIARDGAQISSSDPSDSESIRQGSKIIVAVLVLCAFAIAGGWYYLRGQYDISGPPSIVAIEPEPVIQAMVEVEPVVEPEISRQTLSGARDDVEAEPELETLRDTSPVTKFEPESEAAAEVEDTTDTITQSVVSENPDTAAETDADIEKATHDGDQRIAVTGEDDPNTTRQQAEPNSERFKRELQQSLDWINSSETGVGTHQILVLNFNTFDVSVFYQYVDNLARQQVDISQLRIFKTYTGKSEVYSVVYGMYDSWQAAKLAQQDLPEVLRKIPPIPRSVGGILTEIQRLEINN